MSDASFSDRMSELQMQVGKGLLHTRVTFDQVYARYQDGWGDLGTDTGVITPTQISHGPAGKPGPTFAHPARGRAGYLTESLTEFGESVAESWAASVGNEVPIVTSSIVSGEQMSAIAGARAPLELGFLRGSGGVSVVDDGSTVYDRPPVVPRLSQEALDALRRKKVSLGDTTY